MEHCCCWARHSVTQAKAEHRVSVGDVLEVAVAGLPEFRWQAFRPGRRRSDDAVQGKRLGLFSVANTLRHLLAFGSREVAWKIASKLGTGCLCFATPRRAFALLVE